MAEAEYHHLTHESKEIQVESAIRDGNGVQIDTNYQKKPQVIEYDVPTTVGTGYKTLATYKGTYDGTPGFVRFRISIEGSYKRTHEVDVSWAGANGNIVLLSNNSNAVYDTSYIYFNVPSSASYYSTKPPFLGIYCANSSYSKHITVTVLDSSDDLEWKTDWSGAYPSTTSMSTYSINTSYEFYSNGFVYNSSHTTYSTYTDELRRTYFSGDSLRGYSLCAIDTSGSTSRLLVPNEKFPLPIAFVNPTGTVNSGNPYEGRIFQYNLISYGRLAESINQGGSGFTCPTLTASDGGKTLYVRGSLDTVDDKPVFIPDGNVTLDMSEGGYTYIPFGELYKISTTSAPTTFYWKFENSIAYTLDANGKLSHIDGKEVGGSGGGSYTLTDVQAVFSLQSTPDYSEFPYCAEVSAIGCTPNSYASVTYSNEQSQSLMYSPTAVTDTGVVKIYARQNMGTVTIPSIAIGIEAPELDDAQPISSPIEQRNLTLVSSSDSEYSGFPYKYSFPCVGATATRTADVTFDVSDAQSGNFAPVCETGAGVLYIWAKTAQASARIGYMLYYTDNVTVVSGTVGDDTHPVKIVNGQAVEVTNPLVSMTAGLPYARLIGGVYNDISGTSMTKIGFVSAPEVSNSEYFQRVESSSPYYSLKVLKTGHYLLSIQVYGSPVSVSGGRLEVSLVEGSNLQSTFTINTAGNTGQNVGATMTKIAYFSANTVIGLAGWYQDSNFTVTGAGGNTFLTIMWIGA